MPATFPTRPPPRAAGSEPIPGYRLVARLGGGGFGEVWKCVAPGGLAKAIKFIDLDQHALHADDRALNQELDALEQVKSLRHPFVLSLDRTERTETGLMMVMELADATLQDRFREAVESGLDGVPAAELLPLLAEAAEALDFLTARGLQHLDVKPANLFLIGGHLKLGDFGLVCRLDSPPEAGAWIGVTPKYAAPEVLRGSVSAAVDQYGLALVAYELLTGRFPYKLASAQQVLMMHVEGTPDLSLVTGAEAAAFARALSKRPADRYPSCTAFARELALAVPSQDPPGRSLSRTPMPPPSAVHRLLPRAAAGVVAPREWVEPATDLIRPPLAPAPPAPRPARPPYFALLPTRAVGDDGRFAAAGGDGRSAAEIVHPVIRGSLLETLGIERVTGTELKDLYCRFPVRAEPAELVRKLRAFVEDWKGEVESEGDRELVVLFPVAHNWLRRHFFHAPPRLKVAVCLRAAGETGVTRGEVVAVARECGGDETRSAAMRQGLAAEVLHALRGALSDGADHRTVVRYPVRAPVVLYPVDAMAGEPGPGVDGWTVDLSAGGARVVSAADIRANHFYMRFAEHPSAPRSAVLCAVVRKAVRPAEGRVEYGCRYADDTVPQAGAG